MAFLLPCKDKMTLDMKTIMMTKSHKWEQDSETMCHQQTPHSLHQSIGGVEKMEIVERWGHTVEETDFYIYTDREAGTTDILGGKVM